MNRTNSAAHLAPLLRSHRFLLHLHELSLSVLIVSQVSLVANKDDRDFGTKVFDLGKKGLVISIITQRIPGLYFIACSAADLRSPLVRDILQRIRRVNGETHEYDISVRVRQWSEAVIVLLSSSVPQCQLHLDESTIRHSYSGKS